MLTKQDLNSIRGIVKEEVRSELTPVRKDISNLEKNVKNLRKDLTNTINFFDKADKDTRNKLNRTREELGLKEVVFNY